METTRATVKEIARLAGVSIGTVDRVLHDRGGVSADTKHR
ncbi:MAG TPA: LacI family DNA-binding transcriptional regulator, partial [Polyangia bacterium]